MGSAVSGSIARASGQANMDISVLAPPYLRGDPTPCSDDFDLFFPMGYGLTHARQIREAKERCMTCPMRDVCKEWAIPQPELDGIWGAMTPPERRRVRVRRRELLQDFGTPEDHQERKTA